MKIYSLWLLISLLLLFLTAYFIVKNGEVEKKNGPAVAKLKDNQIQNIFGDNVKKTLIHKPYVHLKINSTDEKIVGYIFNSDDLQVINHGYKTKVKIFLAVDAFRQIKKVILDDIKESPKQIDMITKNGLLKKWEGKQLPQHPPDTVTGATKTSSAINQTVTQILKKIK